MTENKEEKMYELVCKEKFDRLLKGQDEIIKVLKGTNTTPGLCEQIRIVKARQKTWIGGVIFVLSITVAQFIRWIIAKIQ